MKERKEKNCNEDLNSGEKGLHRKQTNKNMVAGTHRKEDRLRPRVQG